jgi:hypothetical protein
MKNAIFWDVTPCDIPEDGTLHELDGRPVYYLLCTNYISVEIGRRCSTPTQISRRSNGAS